MVKLVRFFLREPSNAYLAFHVGFFIVTAQRRIARQNLPQFVAGLRARTMLIPVPRGSHERVVHVRNAWLRQPWLRRNDTCYVRAMTLYRFLDADDTEVRLHIGIETRDSAQDRLRGHAWVSVRGSILEGPEAVAQGRIREIAIPAAAC